MPKCQVPIVTRNLASWHADTNYRALTPFGSLIHRSTRAVGNDGLNHHSPASPDSTFHLPGAHMPHPDPNFSSQSPTQDPEEIPQKPGISGQNRTFSDIDPVPDQQTASNASLNVPIERDTPVPNGRFGDIDLEPKFESSPNPWRQPPEFGKHVDARERVPTSSF
jgi:hypothetical protein